MRGDEEGVAAALDKVMYKIEKNQRADGSWTNRCTDAKEDDPLVASPWAAAALAICRESITGEIKELVPRRGAPMQAGERPRAAHPS